VTMRGRELKQGTKTAVTLAFSRAAGMVHTRIPKNEYAQLDKIAAADGLMEGLLIGSCGLLVSLMNRERSSPENKGVINSFATSRIINSNFLSI
jgi:hypothetical protein